MWATIRQFFTHSRWVAFLGWAGTVWGALELHGPITWPLTVEQRVTIIGVTLAWLGRSGLADKKVVPPAEPTQEPTS